MIMLVLVLLYDFIICWFSQWKRTKTHSKVLHALNVSLVLVSIDSHVVIKAVGWKSKRSGNSNDGLSSKWRQCVWIVFLSAPRKELPRWDLTACKNDKEAKAMKFSLFVAINLRAYLTVELLSTMRFVSLGKNCPSNDQALSIFHLLLHHQSFIRPFNSHVCVFYKLIWTSSETPLDFKFIFLSIVALKVKSVVFFLLLLPDSQKSYN